MEPDEATGRVRSVDGLVTSPEFPMLDGVRGVPAAAQAPTPAVTDSLTSPPFTDFYRNARTRWAGPWR